MKKLLSLFALLVTIVIGAKAADATTVFDAADAGWSADGVNLTSGTTTVGLATVYGGGNMSIDNGKTVEGVAWGKRMKFGGGSTFQKNKTYARVLELDLTSLGTGTLKIYMTTGSNNSERYVYVSKSGTETSTNRDDKTAIGSGSDVAGGSVIDVDIDEATKYAIWVKENIAIYGVTFVPSATAAPTIDTDLDATADVTVGVAQDFTIAATGATKYQWYKASSTTADTENDEAISGATAATYSYTVAAAGTEYIYCVATNSIGSTPSTVCAVTATAPAAAPEITTDLEATYNVNKGSNITLSIVADGASSYQWYKDGEAIEGATEASYTYNANTIGANEFYCVATNAAGPTNSTVATVTTVGRADCKLYEAKYSNSFNAFITEPDGENNGKVQVYYIAGTTAPTVSSTEVSDGATANTSDASQIVVTAEDGSTTATYDVTIEEVTPYTGATIQFDGTESWIKTGNKYIETNNDKTYYAWVINRQLKNTENRDTDARVALGKTRIYFFVDNTTSVKLINDRGSALSTARNINVYVNGVKNTSVTSMPKYDASTPATITIGNLSGASMIEISANQNSGDTGWGKIEMANISETIEVNAEYGARTYVTTNALDFSEVTELEAYIVTGVDTKVRTQKVTEAPAGTALLIKGATAEVPVVASASLDTENQLKPAPVTGDGSTIYVYSKSKKFQPLKDGENLSTGKAYLVIDGAEGESLAIDFDEDVATAINGIGEAKAQVAPVKVIKNGKLYIGNYNVAGQLVK